MFLGKADLSQSKPVSAGNVTALVLRDVTKETSCICEHNLQICERINVPTLGLQSSGFRYYTLMQVGTDVSEEYTACSCNALVPTHEATVFRSRKTAILTIFSINT